MSDPAPAAVPWPDADRRRAFERWLAPHAARWQLDASTLEPASADASFRRYLRIRSQTRSFVVMDAPPAVEDVRPFLHVAGLMRDAGLHGPEVLAADAESGFLLLEDLGDRLYLEALEGAGAADADRLMRDAVDALLAWQTRVPPASLPDYDEALLRRELALFPEWCVEREFGVRWGDRERDVWRKVGDALVASALAQPRCAVHRDWMPRNLMIAAPNPAILDFQDAAHGPVTYDMASLLRDAFVSWDEEREIDWAVRHWTGARDAGLLGEGDLATDFGAYWRALEWMGLQRHLKVIGIFCRLKHRDGKPRYSADLPRFFAYAMRAALRYRELAPLRILIEPLAGIEIESGFSMR